MKKITLRKNTKIYILAPTKSATGGPECLHQLASNFKEVFKIKNVFMVYLPTTTLDPIHQNYKKYNIKFTNIIEDSDDNLLIIPGGVKAMEKVRQNKSIINFISEFNKLNRTIGCICSGAQLLISAKIVKGKKIAGYYSMEDDLTNAGAIYTDREVVFDSKIITTAHYKDMGPWMGETIRQLNNA